MPKNPIFEQTLPVRAVSGRSTLTVRALALVGAVASVGVILGAGQALLFLRDNVNASAAITNSLVTLVKTAQPQSDVLEACINHIPDGHETQAERDCLVEHASGLTAFTQSYQGARILAQWLHANPGDSRARQAGLTMVDAAWASWYKDFRPVFAKYDSRLLKAREQPISGWLMRDQFPVSVRKVETGLAQTEAAILSPEFAQRTAGRKAGHPELDAIAENDRRSTDKPTEAPLKEKQDGAKSP